MTPRASSSVFVVDAIGIRVGIDTSDLDTAGRRAVRHAWRGAAAENGRAVHRAIPLHHRGTTDLMLSLLSSEVTRQAIEENRGALWMLHAAGLAAPDGRVIALVGRSGAGKTTATTVLARQWGYVSDETVGIDDRGVIRPYRKPLSIVTATLPHKLQFAPSDLGLRPLPPVDLRLHRVVLLDRRPHGVPARIVRLPLSEAIAALAPQSSGLVAMPRPLQTIAELLDHTGGAVRAEYTEAQDLLPLLDTLMGPTKRGPAPPVEAATRVDTVSGSDGRRPTEVLARAARYRRGDVVDWRLLEGDRVGVLTGEPDGTGTLRILAGSGTAVWCAADGLTGDEIIRAVTPEEDRPELVGIVLDTIAQLRDAGLLVVSG